MKIYQRFEALSPIYLGGLTNHLPILYTTLKNLGFSENEIIERLENYRDQKGILDLTETSTPKNDFEQEYVNKTSEYLGNLHRFGEDVIIGEFINKYKYNIESDFYNGLIRLAYAKQEKNILMIAQALAYFELVTETMEYPHQNYLNKEDFHATYNAFVQEFTQLDRSLSSNRKMIVYKEILEEEIIRDDLVLVKNIDKEFVLDFLLDNFLKTRNDHSLQLIIGFESLLQLEEYIYDFKQVLQHFLLTIQIFTLLDFCNSEFEKPKKAPFQELEKKIHQLGSSHKLIGFNALVNLNKLFYIEKITTVANALFDE